MEIAGLPLHPLVVHAAVVFVPLAALGAILLAVVPRWRWVTRWPTAAVTIVALGSVVLARLSGEDYLQQRPELAPLVAVHQDRGELLMWFTVAFAVVVAVGVWLLRGASPLPSGRGGRASVAPVLDKVLPVLMVVAAVVVLVQVVLTGDAGTRAVYG